MRVGSPIQLCCQTYLLRVKVSPMRLLLILCVPVCVVDVQEVAKDEGSGLQVLHGGATSPP